MKGERSRGHHQRVVRHRVRDLLQEGFDRLVVIAVLAIEKREVHGNAPEQSKRLLVLRESLS